MGEEFVIFFGVLLIIICVIHGQGKNAPKTRNKYSHRAPGDKGLFGPMYTKRQREAKARYWKNFPRKAMGGSPHIRGYPDKKKRL